MNFYEVTCYLIIITQEEIGRDSINITRFDKISKCTQVILSLYFIMVKNYGGIFLP